MVSVVQPGDFKIVIDDAGAADPFTTGTEVLGVKEFEIRLPEKDVELHTAIASDTANKYFVIDKAATLTEITLRDAIFDGDNFKDYFYGSNFAERGTNTLLIAIRFNRADGKTADVIVDNARVTSMVPKGGAENQAVADITLKASPADTTLAISS